MTLIATAPAPTADATVPVRRAPDRGRSVLFAALITPSAILLAVLTIYPLIYAVSQSVHDGSLIAGGDFVGADNFVRIFQSDLFWQAAWFTLVFTVVGVFGSWIIGLSLALLLRTRIYAAGLLKVLLLLPWIVPVVVSATSWNWLVATRDSPVPQLLHLLGIDGVYLLADPTLAAVTVCVFKVWISFPFMLIMSSAALSTIDPVLYEAAAMDGATPWQRLRLITMPLIAKSTYISWILMMIFCVNDFPTIFLLTGGGPVGATNSLIVLAYRTVFQSYQTGPGMAIALTLTAVLIIVSVVLFRRIRKASVES